MRKLFLPVVAALVILGVGAVAQNINKAIQLSQDPTGAFGVDVNNNAYLPGHVLTVGPGQPVPTSCGSGSPTVTGTDTAGTILTGTTVTGCVVTFNKAYLAAPYCLVTSRAILSQTSYVPYLTGIQLTLNTNGAVTFDYICSGSK